MTSSTPKTDTGPLQGITVVELAGLGPAPFCGMVLADLGAEVMVVNRIAGPDPPLIDHENDLLNRGKRSICVDLRQDAGVEIVLRLVAGAEALIEGFRPGVTERLGIGPAAALARNPALVYGRVTGWGQNGPLAETAGHDIDFISVAGVLGAIGGEDPVVPLNLIGDFGGGGMLLVVGLLAGIISARATGSGQVVDAAMVDGSALLATSHHGFLAGGDWITRRRSNLLDGAAPFYSVYRTSDGRHMAVGALEPQFFEELLSVLEIDRSAVPEQMDRKGWPRMRESFESVFVTRTQEEWVDAFQGRDACVAPVLALSEAPQHPHNVARGTFVDIGDVIQPGVAPRFSGTPAPPTRRPSRPGDSTDSVLERLGYTRGEIGKLRADSVVG